MWLMTCAEKKELQDQCMAACSEFKFVQGQLGLGFDWLTKKWTKESVKAKRIDQTAEFAKLGEALRKYQTASSALSRHLSTHRC